MAAGHATRMAGGFRLSGGMAAGHASLGHGRWVAQVRGIRKRQLVAASGIEAQGIEAHYTQQFEVGTTPLPSCKNCAPGHRGRPFWMTPRRDIHV